MDCAETRLCRALHVHGTLARGNIGWGLFDGNNSASGIIVFGIIVFGIIVRVNIGNNPASGIIVFGIIVRGIIVRVNIGWGLFDGNNSAFGIIVRFEIIARGIIVRVNIVWGLFVIDAARIGSSGSCANTTCWITGSSILAINGTAPGVLLRVWRR